MNIKDTLYNYIATAVASVCSDSGSDSGKMLFNLEHPEDISHGDYATNVALVYSKKLSLKPVDLAQKIVVAIEAQTVGSDSLVEKITIAGPGFINFHLKPNFFRDSVQTILASARSFGSNDFFSRQNINKVIVEYTDPNPFKEFHIGHLMSNTIGESISRIIAFSGAEVKRACYQGDVGLHVAKAIWAYIKDVEKVDSNEIDFGRYYVEGSTQYEENEVAKKEIIAINKKIYSKEDQSVNTVYKKGREASLKYFETIYQKLGTAFDFYFFESDTAPIGVKLVTENSIPSGDKPAIFEKSDGAVVFKGDEDRGLHTRVFINSEGLPTYEAKELGLVECKYKKYPYDLSVYITGNEVRDYFRVLVDAINQVFTDEKLGKDIGDKIKNIKHIPHGMLRLSTGKMSSRKGGVITADSLIANVSQLIVEKVKDAAAGATTAVAIGAIKYSILRQSSGDDIIFDFGKSISFEGDSGPYLQYSTVRAASIREKAIAQGVPTSTESSVYPDSISILEKILYRFPEIVERSAREYEPHYITTYLIELAAAFNNYYAHNQIVSVTDPASPYKVSLTSAFETVMRNGLHLLGISIPEKM